MFWKFLVTMVIADVVCTVAFAFVIVATIAPMVLFARAKSTAITTAVTLFVAVLAFVLQVYFWGLWAAFCSDTAAKYSAMPGVSHHWLYYVFAFTACTAPLGYLAGQEVAAAKDQGEANNTRRGTAMYGAIAIAAFLVFCFWPSLSTAAYSWILRYVV